MEEIENLEGVSNFINACNELVEGKFILADIKISKILKAISESTDVYNLIAENMINYDFDKEFAKAVVKDSHGIEKFQLPDEEEKIIPLVFCLLVEMDSKRINFNEFVKVQFPLANNQNEEYQSFAKTIIIPFRNAVANYFDVDIETTKLIEEDEELRNIIDEKIKEHMIEQELQGSSEEPQETIIVKTATIEPINDDSLLGAVLMAEKQHREDEEIKLLFDRILRLVRILDDKSEYVRNPLKKSNITLLIDALYEAYEIKNVKIIVALVMALNNFAGSERSMRGEIKELNTICYDFYE